jgi:peptidase C39-like protein
MSLNILFAKIDIDTDKDGLSDYEEENIYFTDPHLKDSDLDIYPDALEVYYGYSPAKDKGVKLNKLTLDIPYINESPDGSWTGPWKNGCEEASIAMIENYYLGEKDPTIKESMDYMMALFEKQNNIWNSNADADTHRTDILINDYTQYNSNIIENPTIEQIKKELQQKRPVISYHYGKDLQNPNIPFLSTGSYFHVIVIIGYNDITNEFITHDNGDIKTGEKHRYKYDVIMNSLHDFDFTTRTTTGPPRVIFTYPKLVKATGDPRVYYLKNNTKQWITNEQTFNANGWNWDAINIVQYEWLNEFERGSDISIK